MYSKIFDFIFQNSFSITHKNLFCVPTYSCQILIPTLNFISFQDGNELGTIMSTQGQSYTQSNSQSIRSLVIQSLTDLVVHFLIQNQFCLYASGNLPFTHFMLSCWKAYKLNAWLRLDFQNNLGHRAGRASRVVIGFSYLTSNHPYKLKDSLWDAHYYTFSEYSPCSQFSFHFCLKGEDSK
jgi:hypothetical protein